MKARERFTDRVLREIAKPPTNVAMIAADLRVTKPSVQRVVNTLVKYGVVEHIEVPGYPPHLSLTGEGRERVFPSRRFMELERLKSNDRVVTAKDILGGRR